MSRTKKQDLTPLEIEALNTESVEKDVLGLFTESKQEVKEEPKQASLNTESVEINIDYPTDNVISNSNDVKFLVQYPDDFAGKKWFKDGQVIVTSKESASIFINQKIGKVL